MSFVLQDPTGGALQDLRIDTPDISPYRKLLVYNNQVVSAINPTVSVQETGFSKTDQAFLANRAVISAAYTHSIRGAETSYLATGPVSTQVQLTAELTLTILDGLLQLSTDTFTWANSLTVSSLSARSSTPVWVRYQTPSYPFTTRLTLKNIGANTFTSISLTPPSTDQLSTDGVTYANPGAAITVGTLGPGSSVTFWVKAISIENLIAAQVQVVDSGGTGQASVPVQAAGSRAYCLANDVRQYLTTLDVDTISDDDEIMNLITTAAKSIDRSTRRRFDVVTVTERYDGQGQIKLVLDNYPIISVQEVEIRNTSNQVVTDIKSTDAQFAAELIIDKVNGFLTLPPVSPILVSFPFSTPWFWPYSTYYGYPLQPAMYDYSTRFGVGTSNIAVTYTYGFQQPPEPIRQACMKLVAIELLKKKGASDTQGLASEAVAGVTVQYTPRSSKGGSGPYGHMIGELQAEVKDLLSQYRKRKWLTV